MMNMTAKRMALTAVEAVAGSILISLNLRWLAKLRRHLRNRQVAAR